MFASGNIWLVGPNLLKETKSMAVYVGRILNKFILSEYPSGLTSIFCAAIIIIIFFKKK